jgi:cytidylate kinase
MGVVGLLRGQQKPQGEREMSARTSVRSLTEAIIHASNYREAHHEAGSAQATDLTITVSREVGAGGTSVAAEVGQRLGWPVYDNALLEQIAREMHLRTRLLESVDERRMSWLRHCAESFFAGTPVSENAYVRHLVQSVLSLGTHGACVIVGRGAGFILPPATAVRVRLVAERADRIASLARELHVPAEEAARKIDAIDRERDAFVREHFHKDPRDPASYDLILNSSRFSYEECANLVLAALTQRKAHAEAPRLPA